MIKGKAVYFRGKSAMALQLMNMGHFQDTSLHVKINITHLRSDLKLAYSLYTNISVGVSVQKKGGRRKLLFIAVALIDDDFRCL